MLLAACTGFFPELFARACNDRLCLAHCRLAPEYGRPTARARCASMAMRHACVLSNCVDIKHVVFVCDTIDVHGAVAALGGEELVQWIPCNALHVMVVFGDLSHTFA